MTALYVRELSDIYAEALAMTETETSDLLAQLRKNGHITTADRTDVKVLLERAQALEDETRGAAAEPFEINADAQRVIDAFRTAAAYIALAAADRAE